MKLLGDAAAHMAVIERERAKIERLETYLGSLVIRAGVTLDRPHSWFGWIVQPEDQSLVMVFDTLNWGPGAGPREYLHEALDSLIRSLDTCEGIAIGKPGPHERVGKPGDIRIVEPVTTAQLQLDTPGVSLPEALKRQGEAMVRDLELICGAFMEGQPPGSCFTPAQIAEWISEHRKLEIALQSLAPFMPKSDDPAR